MKIPRAFIATLFALFALSVVTASAHVAPLLAPNPAAEQHMLTLTRKLRCLVCQDQSLAESQAGLARDLRRQVLQMIEAGQSDKQIVDYLTHRYGDFVLYRPPLRSYTLLLWFGPFIFLALGVLIWYIALKKRRAILPADEQLSAASLKQAAELLANND